MFSYLALGAGHPARLLGAFIFGHFGDRAGRKVAFLTNILIVGASTCLTGLLPGYARASIATTAHLADPSSACALAWSEIRRLKTAGDSPHTSKFLVYER